MLWRTDDLESFDYDAFESVVNKSGMGYKYRDGQERDRLIYARWCLTLLTGIVTALSAVFLLYFTTVFHSIKHSMLASSIQHEGEHQQYTTFLRLLAFNAILILFAAFLTCYGEPVAAGSGISEVKTMLNGMKIPRMLRIRTFICKLLGTIFAVSGGLPVGKEGPMIHSGAIVAAGLSQGKSSTLGYDTSFSYFAGLRNDHEKRDFVSCGAAAGVASAFGAPIGGVMFVLEEGASFWSQQLTWRTLFCAMAATFTLAFFISGMSNNLEWGTMGSRSGTFSFGTFGDSTYQVWEVPIFILMGIGGGFQGALFNALNTKFTQLRSRWVTSKNVAILEALLLTVLVTSSAFFTAFYFGKCRNIPMDNGHGYAYKKDLVAFYCPKGEFNDLATLLLSSGESAIKHLFHLPPGSFDVATLLLFWAVFFVLACLTYGLKVPSGLFVPSLLIGAAYGRLWTRLINSVAVSYAFKTVDPRMYGLIGSLAMLGGATRMTISLTVIVLECTGNVEYGLPLILTSFFARWAGNVFNEGIYDIHIHLRHVPFLDWVPSLPGSFLRVKHIMTPNPKTLRTVERAGVIFDLLVTTRHNAFPVIVEDPAFGSRFFAGVILRKQLNVLLAQSDYVGQKPKPFSRKPLKRGPSFRESSSETEELSQRLLSSDTCLSYKDMEAYYPHYPEPSPFPSPYKYSLSEEDRACWVDLTPYMNQTPYLIQEEAPFTRAYKLFRSAGLRHLVVVNRFNNVTGILTRWELQEEHCARCFRLAKHRDPGKLYSHPPSLKRKVSRSEQVKRALSRELPH